MKQLKFDRAVSRHAWPDRAGLRGLSSTCDNSDRNSGALDSSDRLNDRRHWFDLVDLNFYFGYVNYDVIVGHDDAFD